MNYGVIEHVEGNDLNVFFPTTCQAQFFNVLFPVLLAFPHYTRFFQFDSLFPV